MPRARGSNEDFVRFWEESTTVQQVAEKIGVTANHAGRTATKLRKLGVNLKTMATQATKEPINVEALNQIINKVRKEPERTDELGDIRKTL